MVVDFDTLIEKYDSIDIDKDLLIQKKLDLTNERNKNIFAYRGQFSPDLIKTLIFKYAEPDAVILDPFAGCGTTIFEAAKLGYSAIGIEINPAGIIMAKSALFHSLNKPDRESIFKRSLELIENITDSQQDSFDKSLVGPLKNVDNRFVKILLWNSYIKYNELKKERCKTNFLVILNKYIDTIRSLPYSEKLYAMHHCDARSRILEEDSVDLVITSPPYINVFNYHQYYRGGVENLGFDVLGIAKSEFGSNRKNRQNRFLTVIQYIQDMAHVLENLKYYLKTSGRLIIVVGRQTNVRGVPFRNDQIMGCLGMLLGYDLILHQERKFKNKFGQMIYEDILHMRPLSK